jgi:hypothetical protein
MAKPKPKPVYFVYSEYRDEVISPFYDSLEALEKDINNMGLEPEEDECNLYIYCATQTNKTIGRKLAVVDV